MERDSESEGNDNHSNISDHDPCLLFNAFIRFDFKFKKKMTFKIRKKIEAIHGPIM